jgi:hypothetical protein
MILQHSYRHKTLRNKEENALARIILKQRNVNLSVSLDPSRLRITFYGENPLQGTAENLNYDLFKFYDNEDV